MAATSGRMPPAMRLGLIGIGLVGSALAERLLAAGYSLCGYDRDPGRRALFESLGGTFLESPQAVADTCELCLLSLPTSDVVAELLPPLLHSLHGKIVIDTTTGEPEATAERGRLLAEHQIDYLDATIVGSSKQVRTGDVLLLVGGTNAAWHRGQPIFQAVGKQAFHLGETGSGARMKLVVNLVIGLNRAVLAEALSFAKACGVDAAQALEILQAGLSYSRVMDTKGRKMLERDFTVEAKLSQHHKDVGLILAAAARAGIDLPLSRSHDELLAAAERAGHGEADNSAIIAAYDRAGGPQAGHD